MTSTLTNRLRAMGIHNGRQLAEHVDAPAVMYFLVRGPGGNDDPRTELHYRDGDVWKIESFHPDALSLGRLSTIRANCNAQAVAWAAERLGLPEWRRAAFPHCLLPSACIAQMQAEMESV